VVIYLATLLVIATVWAGYAPRTAALLLTAALCLQIYDTKPL
jgi:hypothetical protein